MAYRYNTTDVICNKCAATVRGDTWLGTELSMIEWVIAGKRVCEGCGELIAKDYPEQMCGDCGHALSLHTTNGCCGDEVKSTGCGCTKSVTDEPDSQLLMRAAERIVAARAGEGWLITGCEPPGENSYWQFYVQKRISNRPSNNSLMITNEDLVMVAREEMNIEQIQGRKPRAHEISEAIRAEYSDGVDELFEPRE